MGDGFPFFDILLFAVIAAFLVFRLRGVLGRRDGHQVGRGADPFRGPPPVPPAQEPGPAADGDDEAPREPAPAAVREGPQGLELGLTQIRIADPRFDLNEFLAGAKIAFELILTAFAKGDASELRPLVSPEVYANFAQSLQEREASGETMSATLVGFRSVEATEAYLTGRTAHVTVRFVSQQITVVRDRDGQVVEGDPERTADVTDLWTFARDTRSADPNWALVATGTPD